jgi:hypothetical protein
VFPLLKSSDLGNGRIELRKQVLVTQTHTGVDTATISALAPKTWRYLLAHADALDSRRSSIYQNRPRFAVFGVGPYSFALWKVAISGLYKAPNFVVVPPMDGRPVMVDDTCYSLPCKTEAEATLVCELLSSRPALEFLHSLVFTDSKRPFTVDVLRRLSLVEAARQQGRLAELKALIQAGYALPAGELQMSLLMEP